MNDILAQVLTASEVAARYDKDESSVRYACKRGDLMARNTGGVWLILAASAKALWGSPEEQIDPEHFTRVRDAGKKGHMKALPELVRVVVIGPHPELRTAARVAIQRIGLANDSPTIAALGNLIEAGDEDTLATWQALLSALLARHKFFVWSDAMLAEADEYTLYHMALQDSRKKMEPPDEGG